MNNKLLTTYLILIIATFCCCGKPAKDENNNALALSQGQGAAEKYSIDTKGSVVIWKGANLAGSNTHTGYISISKGELYTQNGQLSGGTAVVGMNTIEDENHDGENGLVKHLKNPDFFDVETFPTATIVLTKTAPASGGNTYITGNLTIKGLTRPVSFPAKVAVKGGIITMAGKLSIDRTLWDIRYKSGKFFDTLADETISDFIEFDITIVAKK